MIEVKNASFGKAHSTETIHFTGGLIAFQIPNGEYGFGPHKVDDEIVYYGLSSIQLAIDAAKVAGVLRVGINQTIHTDTSYPVAIWRPVNTTSVNGLNSAADLWGGISYNSHLNHDSDYETIGRYISVSMQAVGVRVRDIALLHHNQLLMALKENRLKDTSFSNIPMLDLYLAFHSLATELCSARDYLAKLAAMHIQAKDSIDNMPRLEEWLKKPAHKNHSIDPLVNLMMGAWGTNDSPGFLRVLGDLRNKMVHRQPMSANPESSMLRLKETTTGFGPILTIRLNPSRSVTSETNLTTDPFETIFNLANQMEKLATQAAQTSRYEPKIMEFINRAQ